MFRLYLELRRVYSEQRRTPHPVSPTHNSSHLFTSREAQGLRSAARFFGSLSQVRKAKDVGAFPLARFLRSATSREPRPCFEANSFTIRTSIKWTNISFRIRTYEKRGRGRVCLQCLCRPPSDLS